MTLREKSRLSFPKTYRITLGNVAEMDEGTLS